eukprot:940359-Prorocentrum_minimum.AAC.2
MQIVYLTVSDYLTGTPRYSGVYVDALQLRKGQIVEIKGRKLEVRVPSPLSSVPVITPTWAAYIYSTEPLQTEND